MAGRPTDALWGIGARTARKLAAAGITSVGQLARADPVDLAGRFGPTMGPWYRAVALGAGSTEVSADPSWRARAAGNHLPTRHHRAGRTPRTAGRPGSPGRRARGRKGRFAPFFTQTRSLTLPAPTTSAEDITASARLLLDRFEPGRPVRLLGVRADFDRAR
jgi:DNA polymerase IV